MLKVPNASAPASPQPETLPPAAPCIDVKWLLAGRQEVRLLHGQEEYRLRMTRNGKLILTK